MPPRTLFQAPKKVAALLEAGFDRVVAAHQAGIEGYVRGVHEGRLGVTRDGDLGYLAEVTAELPKEAVLAIAGVAADVGGDLKLERDRTRRRALDSWGRLEYGFWTKGSRPTDRDLDDQPLDQPIKPLELEEGADADSSDSQGQG